MCPQFHKTIDVQPEKTHQATPTRSFGAMRCSNLTQRSFIKDVRHGIKSLRIEDVIGIRCKHRHRRASTKNQVKPCSMTLLPVLPLWDEMLSLMMPWYTALWCCHSWCHGTLLCGVVTHDDISHCCVVLSLMMPWHTAVWCCRSWCHGTLLWDVVTHDAMAPAVW